MQKRYDCYKADKGKHFVLTQKGKDTSRTFSGCEVGYVYEDWEHYIPHRLVDDGQFEEVIDPDFVTLPGYRVVYDYNGHQLSCGNPIVFHDKEMAEKYMRSYKHQYGGYGREENPYVIEDTYEGKKPVPNKEYKGKTVYVSDNWFGDLAEIGDLVESKIVGYARDCVLPASNGNNYVQCGEPHSHTKEGATFATFVKIDVDVWEYKGNCLRGHTEEDWTPIPYITST